MRRATILAVALLAGCEDAVQQRQMILTDVKTGCQYIGRQSGKMTPADLKPLVDDQGKQICNTPAAG